MKKIPNKKTMRALLRLREPIYCYCGVQLSIKKIINIKGKYLLLQADEIGEKPMEDRRVVYNMNTNKVLNPGSFSAYEVLEYWPPKRGRND